MPSSYSAANKNENDHSYIDSFTNFVDICILICLFHWETMKYT